MQQSKSVTSHWLFEIGTDGLVHVPLSRLLDVWISSQMKKDSKFLAKLHRFTKVCKERPCLQSYRSLEPLKKFISKDLALKLLSMAPDWLARLHGKHPSWMRNISRRHTISIPNPDIHGAAASLAPCKQQRIHARPCWYQHTQQQESQKLH